MVLVNLTTSTLCRLCPDRKRQAKVSVLIYNSIRDWGLDECSVEIHFREIVDLVSLFREPT